MSEPPFPATPRELLRVLQEFMAGQDTSAGLDVDPVKFGREMVALAESLAVVNAALAAAMVRYDRLNAGSPVALLVQRGHLTRNEAAKLRDLGHKLESSLPATREKLASGKVGVTQAKAIAQLDTRLAETTHPIPAEARQEIEAALAEYATSATTTETARAADNARYRFDPDSVEAEMREERGIMISAMPDGARHLNGLLDATSGAVWEAFFDRMAGPASPDDMRTAAARRADALTDLIEFQQRTTSTGIDADTPDDLRLQESCNGHPVGKPHQHPSTRQTGEDPAAGEPGKGFAWRKTSPANLMIIATHNLLTHKPGAEPATLGDGTVIPAETARRYACEAALNRVILADGDQPLQLGRTRRLFTPMQVKAMTVRDRTCRWKGCEVPAIRCNPHHAVP